MAGNVVIKKRRFLVGKTPWLLGAFGVIILVTMIIQFDMTWNREHVRGVGSDASDVLKLIKINAGLAVPETNPFQPLIDLYDKQKNAQSQLQIQSNLEPIPQTTPTP